MPTGLKRVSVISLTGRLSGICCGGVLTSLWAPINFLTGERLLDFDNLKGGCFEAGSGVANEPSFS